MGVAKYCALVSKILYLLAHRRWLMPQKKRALISVSDKTGVVELVRGLRLLDFEIVSTGGTARVLREDDIDVIDVSEVTGFPECLGGRLKTLDPHIFGGILAKDIPADECTMEKLGLLYFDLVAVNFYPFERTVDEGGVTRIQAIEQIDIGGPSMVRAAAKNADRVTVVVDPADYDEVLAQLQKKGETDWGWRMELMLKAFERTADYDTAIARYLAGRRQAPKV